MSRELNDRERGRIRKLFIEDVRCFAGRQEFNLRPLTFLVGENSTGKSTALGCLQILSNLIHRERLDFNTEPYLMGAFADIVRRSSPRKKEFRLGVDYEYQEGKLEYSITFTEKDKGSEPIIQQYKVGFADGDELILKQKVQASPKRQRYSDMDIQASIEKTSNGKRCTVTAGLESWEPDTRWLLLQALANDKGLLQFIEGKIENDNVFSPLFPSSPLDVYSFAPIRSKPQRTYNPLKEAISPEGSEILVLMNVAREYHESWDELKEQLTEFGKSSGLFTDIDVRKLGKSKSDPFQLQIKVRGPKANLLDVGYGVNQILPILVRIFNAYPETMFLMQQPEVHLHPRGQAELSSLLAQIAQAREHNFIIETHSDAMIDRARIEIMQGRIEPEDVSLIYLEPVGNRVKVHNIHFDRQANLFGAPDSYRDFFLKETNQLLGFDGEWIMCLILDANQYGNFYKNNEDMKPVRQWIDKQKGRITYSPTAKMEQELNSHQGMKQLFGQYRRAEKLRSVSKDQVLQVEKTLNGLSSDDGHIIALAQVAKVKLLVSADKLLHKDFKKLIENGKIYQYKKHKFLLYQNPCPMNG